MVLRGIQGRREAAEPSSISASSRVTLSSDEAVAPVNEIAFVEDIVSFLIFVSWEHLTGWIQAVIEVFEAKHLKANVGKLEKLLEAVGRGNARANRDISARKEKKAVYLGACLDISGSVAGEIDERVTKAKRVHARLANNVWKLRLLTWNVKWRLWQALVLSVMIYCLEAHALAGGMITKLERWATRCLRPIARVPACDPRVEQGLSEKLLRPWFMEDRRHDTSLMPRLVCLGRISFEEESDEPPQTARMEQLSKDLILLRDALKDCAGGGPDPNVGREKT